MVYHHFREFPHISSTFSPFCRNIFHVSPKDRGAKKQVLLQSIARLAILPRRSAKSSQKALQKSHLWAIALAEILGW